LAAAAEQSFQRRALAAGEWHGQVVAIGGMDEDQAVSQRVDLFDPVAGRWTQGPELPGEGMPGLARRPGISTASCMFAAAKDQFIGSVTTERNGSRLAS